MKDTIRECYNKTVTSNKVMNDNKTVTSNKVMKDTIRECYNKTVTSNKVMKYTIKQWHQIKWWKTQ